MQRSGRPAGHASRRRWREDDARVQVQPLPPPPSVFLYRTVVAAVAAAVVSRERQQFEKRAAFSNAASCGAAAVCKILPPSLLHSVTDY